MADMPPEDTGHRLDRIVSRTTGDGRHTILTLHTKHRDTKEVLAPFQFFTNYEGLSVLIRALQQAARHCVDNLAKSGASEELTKPLREIQIEHLQSSSVGLSIDKTAVSLEIQTIEGTITRFAIDPETTKKLAEGLRLCVEQTRGKSSLS